MFLNSFFEFETFFYKTKSESIPKSDCTKDSIYIDDGIIGIVSDSFSIIIPYLGLIFKLIIAKY